MRSQAVAGCPFGDTHEGVMIEEAAPVVDSVVTDRMDLEVLDCGGLSEPPVSRWVASA